MSVQEQVLLIALIFFTLVIITLFTLLLLPAGDGQLTRHGKRRTRVQVLVLGDIGRSPRMQYHALSIAKKGGYVDLVGYLGEYPIAQRALHAEKVVESELHPAIPSNSNITVKPLSPIPEFLKTNNQQWFLIFGPLKVIYQIWSLWLVLGYRTRPAKWMLIQVSDERFGFHQPSMVLQL